MMQPPIGVATNCGNKAASIERSYAHCSMYRNVLCSSAFTPQEHIDLSVVHNDPDVQDMIDCYDALQVYCALTFCNDEPERSYWAARANVGAGTRVPEELRSGHVHNQ